MELTLLSVPWKPLRLNPQSSESHTFLYKFLTSEETTSAGYALCVTNLESFWVENVMETGSFKAKIDRDAARFSSTPLKDLVGLIRQVLEQGEIQLMTQSTGGDVG